MELRVKVLKVVRFVVQVMSFILFCGVFNLTFSDLRKIFDMIIHGRFSADIFLSYSLEILPVILLTIIMGRFFCGWMCAFGSLSEFIFLFSKKIFKFRVILSEKVDYTMKFIKYILLFGIIIFMWILDDTYLEVFDPWTAFAQISKFPTSIKKHPLAFLALAFIIFESMFIERFFCRYLCPLGAVLTILSKIKLLKIKVDEGKCGKCKLCANNCPMKIDIEGISAMKSGECIGCLKCFNNCKKNNSELLVFGVEINRINYILISLVVFISLYWTNTLLNSEENKTTPNNAPTESLVIDSSQETGDGNGDNVNLNNREVSSRINNLSSSHYHDGIYTGVSEGYSPGLTVSVTIRSGKITDIKVISHNETRGYYEEPFRLIPKEIISSDSLKVDAVSGATLSSEGIINAVASALKKAER